MEDGNLELDLPGFRFHPTEEELLEFYLKKMVLGKNMRLDIIGYLNIYHHDPWSLPGLAKIDGEREWYFFVPRDRKHGSGGRPNRTTKNGFWKATGSDRKIFGLSDPKKHLGLKKTLVFYKGRAPRGSKTDWVMNEYRLPDSCPLPKDIVLCKIYRKATSLKVLEARAAMGDQEMKTIKLAQASPPFSTTTMETASFSVQNDDASVQRPPMGSCQVAASVDDDELRRDLLLMLDSNLKDEPEETSDAINNGNSNFSLDIVGLKLPMGNDKLPELQLPKLNMDWQQDSFGTQLCSPWLENLTLTPLAYANLLNL